MVQEIENLKRQVSRLTQVRMDRDSYIQDLITDAQTAQRRHEGELARSTARNQRDFNERLTAQQREHDLHLEERTRVHAAALAQQAFQHELELAELRKTLRSDGERRLAEQLAATAVVNRRGLDEVASKLEELRRQLQGYSTTVIETRCSVLDTGGLGARAAPTFAGAVLANVEAKCSTSCSSPHAWGRASSLQMEPEPEEGHQSPPGHSASVPEEAGACVDEPYSQLALAEQAGARALEDVLRRIKGLQGDLLRHAGQVLETSAVAPRTEPNPQVKVAQSKTELPDVKATELADRASAALLRAESRWEMLVLFRSWAQQTSSSRQCAQLGQEAKLREDHLQESGRRLRGKSSAVLAASSSRLCLQTAFGAWAKEATLSKSQAAHEAALATAKALAEDIQTEAAQRALKCKAAICALGLKGALQSEERWRLCLFRAWAAAAAQSRLTRDCQQQLDAAAAERHQEVAALEAAAAERSRVLRMRILDQAAGRIQSEQCRIQALVLQAWLASTSLSRMAAAHQQECAHAAAAFARDQRAKELAAQEQERSQIVYQALRTWAAVVSSAKVEAALDSRLKAQAKASAVELGSLKESYQQRLVSLSAQRKAALQRASTSSSHRHLATALVAWAVAVRDRRHEAAHRRRVLDMEADYTSEIYRLKNESKRTATDLRKQRRAHGVAAVHASLDRRLQSVLHAWAGVSREAQREAIYQRQLDIAAAESAASCAVLRMEGRRNLLEMRQQRQAQAERAIAASGRQLLHTILFAWSAAVAETRHETCFLQQLSVAIAQADEACNQAREAEARHSNALREAEERLVQAEAAHAAALEVKVEETKKRQVEVMQLAERLQALVGAAEEVGDASCSNHSELSKLKDQVAEFRSQLNQGSAV